MRARLARASWLCGAVFGAMAAEPAASAQAPPLPQPVPLVLPFAPLSQGDRGGDASSSGWSLSSPLRLSLQAAVPKLAGGFPQCASLEDDSGNSVGGIPVQHSWEWRLAPRLVFSAFSELGCPIDAGLGGLQTRGGTHQVLFAVGGF